ncbi:PepSY domain-containing protein [Acinetobacter junii]|uniref:PepSY domain-containing protein n=1 Tax=Acinetobacter junii TaxID=40215 RepID=UPI003A8A70B9
MNANQLKKLLKFHRGFGMVLGILVLMWSLTGVLHPIMSATQPQPAKRMPPSQQLDLRDGLSVPQVLEMQKITEFSALQVIELNKDLIAYRVLKPNQNIAEYFDLHTGQLIEDAELKDAKRLAVWYTSLSQQQIISAELVTQFSDDYPSVNLLLPVWRVDFDTGLRAYVDPAQSRLATISNDQKMWMARIFRLGHTWTWGDQPWTGQSFLMQIALISILTLTLMGIGLFFKIHNRKNHRLGKKPIRFFHRYLGISLSVFILLWVFSGFYHVWHKKPELINIQPIFHTQDLNPEAWQLAVQRPIQRLNLVPIAFNQNQAHAGWMVQLTGKPQLQGSMTAAKEHDHHHRAKDAAPTIELIDAKHARKLNPLEQSKYLAAYYLNLPLEHFTQSSWVTRFGGEYGFINKRLPVIKVETNLNDQLRLYIEPSSGVIAEQVNQQDAIEGFSFAYLHKWTWLPIDKTLRDILLATIAGLITVLVILGSVLAIRKR